MMRKAKGTRELKHGVRMALALGAVLATGACAGGAETKPPAEHPDALLPDTPPRSVPKASELVKQGEQKLQQNDPAGARTLFEQAIAEQPDDPRAHLDLGITFEMLGDAAAAEASYRRAIELSPELAEALNNLAVLLRLRGELDESVALLQRAIAADGQSAAAYTNLALAQEDRGELRDAERAYRQALSIDDAAVMTRINLGLLLVRMGDADAAREELRSALPGAAGNRAALLAIGNGLRRAGDSAGAVQAMQAAVDADDEPTPALLSELALAQRADGDRAAAIATLERVLKADPSYATAHYLLGNMLAGAGRFGPARRHYQRYLKLAPDGPHAGRARERLGKLP
jgi:Flp pilus assembly protein TadD